MGISGFEKVRKFRYGVIDKLYFIYDITVYRYNARIKISGDLRGPKRSKTFEPKSPRGCFCVFFYRHNRELKFRVCELLSHKCFFPKILFSGISFWTF